MRIACPKCEWEPTATDLWACSPGCGNAWNTFETMGRCPNCGKVWRETCCHRCAKWSPHFDWYHDLPEIEITEESLETARN
jgi:hypothetical protein